MAGNVHSFSYLVRQQVLSLTYFSKTLLGRRMPHNNRVSGSAALRTNGESFDALFWHFVAVFNENFLFIARHLEQNYWTQSIQER
jgi:hypothetical protein